MEKPRRESVMVGQSVFESDQGDFRGGALNRPEGALALPTAQLGLWGFLATVTMLFAGFTSAYLVRQTSGSDWQPIPLLPTLWLNTALIILSSVTMEVGRAQHRRREDPLKGWIFATTLLGVAFLAGQLFVWRQLAARGVYLPSNPHSSFFYILTGVHGLHLLGGLGVLVYLLAEAWQDGSRPALHSRLKLCATYWHFVGGLWLYLFVVLFVLG